jgi:hypothetical protein
MVLFFLKHIDLSKEGYTLFNADPGKIVKSRDTSLNFLIIKKLPKRIFKNPFINFKLILIHILTQFFPRETTKNRKENAEIKDNIKIEQFHIYYFDFSHK